MDECPKCGSKNPAWHPATQADGGEVFLCRDPWHKPTADEIEARERLLAVFDPNLRIFG